MTNTLTLRIATVLVKRLKARRAEHQELRAREGWVEYCVHGTYIGTWWGPDYLCGACEDGTSDYEMALWQARSIVAEFQTRCEAMTALNAAGFRDADAWNAITKWASEPINEVL